jgi:hypothetical protein
MAVALFSRQPQEPVDPVLAALAAGYTEPDSKWTLRALAKHQDELKGMLSPDETITAIAGDGSALVAITDRRSIKIEKGLTTKIIEHTDIAETNMFTLANRSVALNIESSSAHLDFRPDDPLRYQKIIQITASTPRPLHAVLEAIKSAASA